MRPYRAIPIGGKDFVYGWYGEDKDGKCWIYHTITTFDTSHLDKFTKVIPESVAQQVGRQDKNKDEIYEGDIITLSYGIPPIQDTLIIEYVDDEVIADISVSGWWMRNIRPNGCSTSLCKTYEGNIEIIGNVHQNPKLIK